MQERDYSDSERDLPGAEEHEMHGGAMDDLALRANKKNPTDDFLSSRRRHRGAIKSPPSFQSSSSS